MLLALASIVSRAQTDFEGVVRFDKTIHNFGDILLSDGPQKCEFTFTNISNKPIVVHKAISSCGCTEPLWPAAPLRPGESGKIKVTYRNDQGPYPFDKTITVYVASLSQPVRLYIKGNVHEKQKSLEELFPKAHGVLALREEPLNFGQLDQGQAVTASFEIANLGRKDAEVNFSSLAPGLSVKVEPNPLPARSKGTLVCSYDTKAAAGKAWGRQQLEAVMSANGSECPGSLSLKVLVKEDFSSLSEEARANAPQISLERSSFHCGDVKRGSVNTAVFELKNIGRQDLLLYKIDGSPEGDIVTVEAPSKVASGEKAVIKVKWRATAEADSEYLNILTLVTNAPSRGLVNLFITATIK